MIRFEFPPPTNPWSTNEDRRLNRYVRNERIQTWKQATYVYYRTAMKRQGLPLEINEKGIVQVEIPFTRHRRRDPHNYCGTIVKAIIDGLIHAGAWPDDTPEYVGHREPVITDGELVVVTIDY